MKVIHRSDEIAKALIGKAFGDDMVDQSGQRLPICFCIQKENRLLVQAQLSPCQHLEKLVDVTATDEEREEFRRDWHDRVRTVLTDDSLFETRYVEGTGE